MRRNAAIHTSVVLLVVLVVLWKPQNIYKIKTKCVSNY